MLYSLNADAAMYGSDYNVCLHAVWISIISILLCYFKYNLAFNIMYTKKIRKNNIVKKYKNLNLICTC
jgi:hypothetical protein